MTTSASSVPQRVLIVGCGRLGIELGQRLTDAGSQVFGLRRDPSQLPTVFQPLAVDLTQPVSEALPEVDAMVITLTPSIKDPAGNTSYLLALRHLADALPHVPARVLFVSSTRVFEGAATDAALTESDAVAPVSERGHTLVEAERLAQELFGAHIVRPAGIYGLGRDMLIRKVVNHEPVQYARRTNRIHQTDLARALQMLLTVESAPDILHAIDQTPGVPLGEVVHYIATRLGETPPPAMKPAEPTGRVLSGERLVSLLKTLHYPTYRHGYDQLIEAHETSA